MVRLVLVFFIVINVLNAKENIFEKNCIPCHQNIPVSIDKFFYRYLLKYSSERTVKMYMMEYLKNPNKMKSIVPEAFLDRFGVKEKTKLNNMQLKEAIDDYWEKYKVFGKLK